MDYLTVNELRPAGRFRHLFSLANDEKGESSSVVYTVGGRSPYLNYREQCREGEECFDVLAYDTRIQTT